jgi:DnaK suppressor protein
MSLNIEEIKNNLLKEKEELEIILKSINEEIEYIRSNEVYEYSEVAEAYEEKQDLHIKKEKIEERIKKILNTLEKIEKGNFGMCVKCGNPIEEVRIKFDPTLEYCRNCI